MVDQSKILSEGKLTDWIKKAFVAIKEKIKKMWSWFNEKLMELKKAANEIIDTSVEKYASVTVVVPCFRCVKTIDRAIQSVANQTLIPREVILVDDCSNDGTLEKIFELQQRYDKDWIRIITVSYTHLTLATKRIV